MPRKSTAELRAELEAKLASLDAKALDKLDVQISKERELLALDEEREQKAAAKVLARQEKIAALVEERAALAAANQSADVNA